MVLRLIFVLMLVLLAACGAGVREESRANSLTVSDQTLSLYSRITIDHLDLSQSALLVVHESDILGRFGRVLHQQVFDAGLYEMHEMILQSFVPVNTVREYGSRLHVVVYTDVNADGMLDDEDQRLLDENGNTVSASFEIASNETTVHARVQVMVNDAGEFVWVDVADDLESFSADGSAVSFRQGRRYQIENLSLSEHPLAFVDEQGEAFITQSSQDAMLNINVDNAFGNTHTAYRSVNSFSLSGQVFIE